MLSVASRADLDRWIESGPLARLRDAHRGTVRPGQPTLLPIVVRNVPRGAALDADLKVVASDGRIVLDRPACCKAAQERAPGLYLLEPVPELTLMPGDLAGLYTVIAIVRDQTGAQATARERIVHTP